MKLVSVFTLFATLATTSVATAGVQEAIDAMNRGGYETAYKELSTLADEGNDNTGPIRPASA